MRSGKPNEFWRINERIQATRLRVIGPDGKQIGILSREEAIAKSQEQELDLVEIAPHANPPVVKIIDFTKFKYEQEKKAREERKKEKRGTTIKEVWFRPLIAQGDYQTRFEKVADFLAEGAKVRVTVKPKRRLDNTSPLYRIIGRVITDSVEIAKIEQSPRLLGKQLVMLLSPQRGVIKENTVQSAKNVEQLGNNEKESTHGQEEKKNEDKKIGPTEV